MEKVGTYIMDLASMYDDENLGLSLITFDDYALIYTQRYFKRFLFIPRIPIT